MTRILERRLIRLEQATGAQNDDELVEFEFSEVAKDILRAALISLGSMTPEEIEATVKKRQLLPRSCRLELSPAARAQFEENPSNDEATAASA